MESPLASGTTEAATTDPATSARTIARPCLAGVLSVDIVDYSRKPVTEQIALKERFTALVGASIGRIAPHDRIVLDTADGVAVSFLGRAEDALAVALHLRNAFRGALPGGADLQARMGINLGPVRLARDPTGQPNVIGDGVNVARRVMRFAAPGEVLVSRAYHDAVAHLAAEDARLFSYRGARTDTHVREHEIFALSPAVPASVTRALGLDTEDGPVPGRRTAGRKVDASVAGDGTSGATRRPPTRLALAAVSVTAITVAVMVARSAIGPDVDGSTVKVGPEPREALRPAATPPSPAEPPAPSALAARDALEAPPPAPAPAGASPVRESRVAVARPPRPRNPAAAQPSAPALPVPPPPQAEPAAAEKAVIALAVSPWGEVYVNGSRVGVTPPVNVVEVSPGKVDIEIRNGASAPYAESLDLSPGQRVRVKHRF